MGHVVQWVVQSEPPHVRAAVCRVPGHGASPHHECGLPVNSTLLRRRHRALGSAGNWLVVVASLVLDWAYT
jgi:hypothetical protein